MSERLYSYLIIFQFSNVVTWFYKRSIPQQGRVQSGYMTSLNVMTTRYFTILVMQMVWLVYWEHEDGLLSRIGLLLKTLGLGFLKMKLPASLLNMTHSLMQLFVEVVMMQLRIREKNLCISLALFSQLNLLVDHSIDL